MNALSGVVNVGPASPISALLLSQSAGTPPSARLDLDEADSDHSNDFTAQMVLGINYGGIDEISAPCNVLKSGMRGRVDQW